MYFFTFLAKPAQNNPRRFDYDGAFVNCWVNLNNPTEAEQSARAEIEGCGWRIEAVETSCLVTRERCGHQGDDIKRFQQAEHDGSCVVFETWSKAIDDDD